MLLDEATKTLWRRSFAYMLGRLEALEEAEKICSCDECKRAIDLMPRQCFGLPENQGDNHEH